MLRITKPSRKRRIRYEAPTPLIRIYRISRILRNVLRRRASDADRISFIQITYLCTDSALAMGIGIGGYVLITEDKDDAI